jgi:hypothetical protein
MRRGKLFPQSDMAQLWDSHMLYLYHASLTLWLALQATTTNNIEFRGTPQGYYQDSGCTISGRRSVPPSVPPPDAALAPAPAPSTVSLSVSSVDVLGGPTLSGSNPVGVRPDAVAP